MAKACFQCGGSGKVHRSSMSHGPGCIFCKKCEGCDGTGAIPSNANACPKCRGEGRYHDSTMPHSPDCIFCTPCATCDRKGWLASDTAGDLSAFVGAVLQSVEKRGPSWIFPFGDRLGIATVQPWRLVTPEGIAVASDGATQVEAARRVMALLASRPVQGASVALATGDLSIAFADGREIHLLQVSSDQESWRATTGEGEFVCQGGGRIAFFPANFPAR